MREFLAPGSGPMPPRKPRGKVIAMPTPKVVRQRRSVRLGMLALGVVFIVALAARVYLTARMPPSTEQVAGVSGEEAWVLEFVNRERAKTSLPALKLSGRLAVAARGHSYDMALRHYFSHQSADGITPEQRLRGSGIDYAEMGENIYTEDFPDHERTARRAIEGWLASPGHRKNMLSPRFKQTGVGVAHAADGSTYITQDFIRE